MVDDKICDQYYQLGISVDTRAEGIFSDAETRGVGTQKNLLVQQLEGTGEVSAQSFLN